jgi:hypothetical protein
VAWCVDSAPAAPTTTELSLNVQPSMVAVLFRYIAAQQTGAALSVNVQLRTTDCTAATADAVETATAPPQPDV